MGSGGGFYSFVGASNGAFVQNAGTADREWPSCADPNDQPCLPLTGAPFSRLMPLGTESNYAAAGVSPLAQGYCGCAYINGNLFIVGGVDGAAATTGIIQ